MKLNDKDIGYPERIGVDGDVGMLANRHVEGLLLLEQWHSKQDIIE